MDRTLNEVLASQVESIQLGNAPLTELDLLQLAIVGGGIADVIGV